MIDQKEDGIYPSPELVEGQLADLTLVKEEGLVGETTEFEFELTTLNSIPTKGKLTISFEDNTFQEPSSKLICSKKDFRAVRFDCSFQTYPSGMVSSVTVS